MARAVLGQELLAVELKVLRRMAYGMSNAEIGVALCLSEDTVKMYARYINIKFGVDNRVQAIVHAYESGILSCPCSKKVEPQAVAS